LRSQPAKRAAGSGCRQGQCTCSPELIAQRREAVQDIQAMILTGEWGNTERAQFQQKFSLLDPEQASSGVCSRYNGTQQRNHPLANRLPL